MKVLVRDVMKAAADQAGITVADMQSPDRSMRTCWPRMRAMYVARQVTNVSHAMITRHFGDRDHTTSVNACKKVPERMAEDPAEQALVDDLLAIFQPSISKTVALVIAETDGLAA